MPKNLAEVKQKVNRHLASKFEQAILRISPQLAVKRVSAVVDYMMTAYSFDAASKISSSFEQYSVGVGDADTAMDFGERATMIDRSHDQIRNTPIAGGIINRIVDHAIGPNGLTFHPQIDAAVLGMTPDQKIAWEKKAKYWFQMWAESKEADMMRGLNFYEQTNLALRSEFESGDCFDLILGEDRPGSPFNLKIQTVEGAMVSNPNGSQNTESLYEGVQKDAFGVPEKYWFSKYHPGNIRAYGVSNTWDARNIFGSTSGRRHILHHYVQLRPGQTRGIPLLGPVTEKLLNMKRLSNSELLAAALNSLYTIIISAPKQNTKINKQAPIADTTPNSKDKLAMGPGSIFRIGPNDRVEGFDPKRPNQLYMPFFEAMVMEIGSYCGVPKSLILMTFDKSYSASRGEVILFWVTVLAHRVRKAVGRCQPIWEALLDELVATRKIYAPGYFRDEQIKKAYRGSAYNQWVGPVREAIDELVEAKAAESKITSGIKTRKIITAEKEGKDWETEVFAQLKHEHDLLVAAGMAEPLQFDLVTVDTGKQ